MGSNTVVESNKNIIRSMYEYYNQREWEKLSELLHVDFMKTRIIDNENYDRKIRESKRRFMLAIFNKKTKEEMNKTWEHFRNHVEKNPKEGVVQIMKSNTEKEGIKRQIIRMIAENDEVWVKERYSGTGFYEKAEYDFEVDSIFFLKEGKIIDIYELSDDFVFFLQLGGLRAKSTQKEDLTEYLESLKEIGLLPQNVEFINDTSTID